jgi:hypothetical protein
MKEALVYRHVDADNILLITTLSFPPRWANKQNLRRQGNTVKKFKVRLLNYGSIKWLCIKWIIVT